jgi:hypothetical protein
MSAKRLRMSLSCRIRAIDSKVVGPELKSPVLFDSRANLSQRTGASDHGNLVGYKEKVKEMLDIRSIGM